jgi:fatty acid desaturase
MSSNDPHARYALRGAADADGDLRQQNFESQVSSAWFTPAVDRKLLKQLMKRSDMPALRDHGLWVGLLIASGALAFAAWGSWWALPAFLVYGVLYSASDHRAHELSHGTPFKTRWLNEAFFRLASFMTLHEGHYWRWSHTRHHTHTIIVGRDPEIAVPRPVRPSRLLADLFFLRSGTEMIATICRHAAGRITPTGQHFIPASERSKVIAASRAYVLVFAAVVGGCIATQSLLPAMLVVLPRFYGGFLAQIFNVTQHAGLAEDVHDHRLNTRTFLTNPVFRWLYANMNYHVEHHMFPMVPYHRLPELHAAIRAQCPAPYPSLPAVWREMGPALRMQARDRDHALSRPLPAPQG